MATGKHFRNDKRTSSFYVMVMMGGFTALCLLAMWILSRQEEETTIRLGKMSMIVDQLYKERTAIGRNHQFEERSYEFQQKVDVGENSSKSKAKPMAGPLAEEEEEEEVLVEEEASEGKEKQNIMMEEEVIGGEKKENSEGIAGVQEANESGSQWRLCDDVEGISAVDYIPCLDNWEAIRKLPNSTKHHEHGERDCPSSSPTCLVPLPPGYRTPIKWPASREQVWYSNVPHPGLVSGEIGDTIRFEPGAMMQYIEFVEQTLPDIAFGNHTRVVLDVDCGVASFGGYLLDKDVLTMSFAPKDDARIQAALERGIPAISAVMGNQRLPFPSNVFDAVHCAPCRVPWHIQAGKLLLELNRILRPGGYFIWSAIPVYSKDIVDRAVWKETVALTAAMCWELAAKTTDSSTGVGIAIFHKPMSDFCYENRKKNDPPMCDGKDDADAAWYIPIKACIHHIPSDQENDSGVEWPEDWPSRLTTAPVWLNKEKGSLARSGKPVSVADFQSNTERWQHLVRSSYLQKLGIDWSSIRNVMDMNAVYGGFAAALSSQPLWVMNVVPYDAPHTLPVIYDRGLLGIYHDWCESFSSYPRTYDLLHSDHVFNKLRKRCGIKGTVVEMDRLLRPQGWAIIREKMDAMEEIESVIKSLQWRIEARQVRDGEGLLVAQKKKWRPLLPKT